MTYEAWRISYQSSEQAARAAYEEYGQLRARIEAMEKQEPVAEWVDSTFDQYPHLKWKAPYKAIMGTKLYTKLYALPGAQPAPIEQDTSVRKAWARFSNELHRSPDAPYPGMADAFERHFSQSFTDREWRAESATWAAAWKAAKRHEAQAQPAPSFADAYQGAMEEVAIWKKRALEAEDMNRKFIAEINGPTHMGEPAQPAPSIPEGWKLVPTAESRHPGIYKMLGALHVVDNTPGASEWESYAAFLAAAPEAKP